MKTQSELLNEIDLNSLSLLVSEKLGYFVSFTGSIGIRKNRDEYYLSITSNDLLQHAGILKNVLSSLVLSNFGGGFTSTMAQYNLPLHFAYTLKDGGRNGNGLFTAYWIFEQKRWILATL